jgi:hypothetical protein
MENIIIGEALTRKVTIDGKELLPEKSQRVYNHSPNGFNWGYGGSGPAQLALAILLEFTDIGQAMTLHQEFKWKVITKLLQGIDFELKIDVKAWINKKWGKKKNEDV